MYVVRETRAIRSGCCIDTRSIRRSRHALDFSVRLCPQLTPDRRSLLARCATRFEDRAAPSELRRDCERYECVIVIPAFEAPAVVPITSQSIAQAIEQRDRDAASEHPRPSEQPIKLVQRYLGARMTVAVHHRLQGAVTAGGEGGLAGWPADQLPVAPDSAMSSTAFATALSA
jgi:hypothetical protein